MDTTPTRADRLRLLKQDVGIPTMGRMVPHFHLNTKLAHILVRLSADGNCEENWLRAARSLVDCLPPPNASIVNCGQSGEPKDPWRGARLAVMDIEPETELKNPAEAIGTMLEIARRGTSHPDIFNQDHRNLLEILEQCGIATGETPEALKTRHNRMAKEAEALNDMMEADLATGVCRETKLAGGGRLIEPHLHGTNGFPWGWIPGPSMGDISCGTLVIEGLGGSTARFPVLAKPQDCALAVQKFGSTATSITNLAETVRDALRQILGAETEIHECYEDDPKELGLPWIPDTTRIAGGTNEAAQWARSNPANETLAKLVAVMLTRPWTSWGQAHQTPENR